VSPRGGGLKQAALLGQRTRAEERAGGLRYAPREFVKSAASEAELRVVDMADEEIRGLLQHAERIGLRVEPAPTH
jgi:hypothetical protein